MRSFLGREREIELFRGLRRKAVSSLVVVRGRRRIGKSTFVRHCAKDFDHFFAFEGLPPRPNQTAADQLSAFAERLSRDTSLPRLALESWPQAFQLLSSVLPSRGWTVLLLDELSWMGIGDPDFAGHIKAAWDNDWSRRDRLIVVLCGSVSTWIERNILNSTGFVGRVAHEFDLGPLPLSACNGFWRGRRVSAEEKLTMLAVTGGVPRYLEEIDPKRSAEENIKRMCFEPGALLLREFEEVFSDIFGRRTSTYRRVVKALVNGPCTVSEVSAALKQGRGGTLAAALGELTKAGFVSEDVGFDPATGGARRASRFRLSDNYLRFYLKYVAPKKRRVEQGLLRSVAVERLTGWNTVLGLQAENLVLSSLPDLWRASGLDDVAFEHVGPYNQRATKRRQGCQIDLLARRAGRVYVFEVKFRRKIPASTAAEVDEKVARLELPRSISVRTGLVYAGELPAALATDAFDYLVPMSALLTAARGV